MATPVKDNPKLKRGIQTGKRNDKYRKKEVKDLIVKKRTAGLSWDEIVKEIEKKFGFTMMDNTAKKVYEEAIAEGMLKSSAVNKTFKKYAGQMTERYEKACKLVDWLVESIERIKQEFDSEDLNELQRYIKFIKLAPTIIATSREILNQLEFIRREQERIKVQQTNLIYSPIQITQHLHKYLNDYVREGKIKILKEIPEIRTLAVDRIKKKKKKEDKDGQEETETE